MHRTFRHERRAGGRWCMPYGYLHSFVRNTFVFICNFICYVHTKVRRYEGTIWMHACMVGWLIDFNTFTSTETPIAALPTRLGFADPPGLCRPAWALPTHLRRAIYEFYSRIMRSLDNCCSCYLCSYCHDADWSVTSSVRISARVP